METQNSINGYQPQNKDHHKNHKDRSLASDGPISKSEGTDSPDLNENETPKSFNRDKKAINQGFHDDNLDGGSPRLASDNLH